MLVELGLTAEVRMGLILTVTPDEDLVRLLAKIGRPPQETSAAYVAAEAWVRRIVNEAKHEETVLRELGAKAVACDAVEVGCKCSILFLEGPGGKVLPLDATSASHIYRVDPLTRRAVAVGLGAMVNHYRTCKDPGKFSQRTRKP